MNGKKAGKKKNTGPNRLGSIPERKIDSSGMGELGRLASFPRFNPQPVMEVDLSGSVLYLNPAARRLFPDLEEKGAEHPFFTDFNKITKIIIGKKQGTYNREIQIDNAWFEQFFSYVDEYENVRVYGVDVTKRKQKETEVQRLNRTLRAISNSNQAMMHASNEKELLDAACRIVVEDCGHLLVWIGFAEQDEEKTVRPVAQFGFDEGYIENLNITWADTERGRGPTGTAVRTGAPCVCRNMQTDPHFLPWREAATKRGYAASIVLPLKEGGKTFGAINIYSKDPDPFSAEEIALLDELACDLSYGIGSIKIREARDRAESALVKARNDLETRVLERTAELNLSNKSLEFERRRFHEVLDVLPAYVVLLTPDYFVPFANRFFIERFGESGGRRCYEYLFGRSEPCEVCETYKVLTTKTRHEWEWTGPDGRNYDIYDFPFTDADGSPLILEMGLDITERKQNQAELERHRNHLEELVKSRTRELESSNARLQKEIAVRTQVEELTLLQNSVLDGINRILHASMTSTSEEELGCFCLSIVEAVTRSKFSFVGEINPGGRLNDIAVSDSWWSVYLQMNPAAERVAQKDLLIRGIFGRVLNEGESIFTNDPASHPDSVGLPTWHPRLDAFLGVPLILAGDTIGMVGVANREGGYDEEVEEALVSMSDAIVEAFLRFRAERALRESEERYRSLFNGMTEGFALHEIILADNGKPCDYRFIEINPAFVRLTGLAREDVIGKLTRSLLPIAHRGLIEIYDEVAISGNPIHSESYFPRLKKHFEVFAYSPAPMLVAVQLMDITERKEAEEILKRDKETFERLVTERTQELVEAQARLAHAKRLSDIGTLSSTVAHELRNPLAVISMAAVNIKRKVKDQSIDRSLSSIQKKITESNQIITNLLFYSRLRVPQYENVSVRDLVLESVETAKTHLDGNVAIRTDLDSILDLSIEADPLQLREVLTNLINNALDAVQDLTGRIIITSSASVESIRITVEDNGVGIPAGELEKIFEPFFTTKTKGTGLGLTVCDQVIRMHGGKIEVRSERNAGTVFTVTLPRKRVDAD